MAAYEIGGKVFEIPGTLQGEDLKQLLKDIQDVIFAFGWNHSAHPQPQVATPSHQGT